jgi:hypothetical protein
VKTSVGGRLAARVEGDPELAEPGDQFVPEHGRLPGQRLLRGGKRAGAGLVVEAELLPPAALRVGDALSEQPGHPAHVQGRDGMQGAAHQPGPYDGGAVRSGRAGGVHGGDGEPCAADPQLQAAGLGVLRLEGRGPAGGLGGIAWPLAGECLGPQPHGPYVGGGQRLHDGHPAGPGRLSPSVHQGVARHPHGGCRHRAERRRPEQQRTKRRWSPMADFFTAMLGKAALALLEALVLRLLMQVWAAYARSQRAVAGAA